MTTPWKIGDLGRFSAESSKRPRFELLGRTDDKKSVRIWYGGQTEQTTILVDTFLKDCVKTWELLEIVPARPPWLREKAEFEFPQNAYVSVKQAEIIDPRYGHRTHATSISLRGEKVTIRSIRLDYASCFVPSSKVLALVPLVLIIKHGVQRRTRWDVVEDNLADDDAEELDANLFKDL
jgi:ribosomal protein S8E